MINGGNTRTKSVYNALKYISTIEQLPKKVLIHDAARPCVSSEDMKKILYHSRNLITGVSPGYPLTNALKRVNKNLIVIDNIRRNNLFMSFTPQAYIFTKLLEAYNVIIDKKIQVDDEIEAMAQLNYKVKIIRTSIDNIKLTYIDDLNENNIIVSFIGDRHQFDQKLSKSISYAENLTSNNTGMRLNIAVNYGGKWDIINAFKKLCLEHNGNIEPDMVDENEIAKHLSVTSTNPDLLIRTGGERRLSNFMLWQHAYTELYFTDCFWPDFDAATFDSAILDYQKRQRRFGKRDEASSGKGNKCAQTAN